MKTTIFAIISSFAISAIACRLSIPFLRRIKFGQQVREDGPKEHLKKAGTPTMGGLAFLLSIALVSIYFIVVEKKLDILPVLLVTLSCGVLGFLDDYTKVVKKRSEGLNPKQKMIGQLLIAGLFCAYMMTNSIGTKIMLPFSDGKQIELGWFFIPYCIFVMIGTDNGANLTDGIDGLCASVTIIIAAFIAIVAIGNSNSEVNLVAGAVIGALLGFLLFNAYPAKLFMGDTGSLAIGGFVASGAFELNLSLFIILFGVIYLIQSISVIMQVTYFKMTKGKRLFKMAPIHHHFELMGWSETRIVTVFTIITILMCLVAFIGL